VRRAKERHLRDDEIGELVVLEIGVGRLLEDESVASTILLLKVLRGTEALHLAR
jgi:hypothetical protein